MKTQTLFSLPFFNGSLHEAVKYIRHSIQEKKFLGVATPNPEQIILAQNDTNFQKVLEQFDLFLPDGQGIIWASKRLGTPLQERITGVEVVERLLMIVRDKNWKVLVVGGEGYEKEIINVQIPIIKKIQTETCDVFWVAGFDKSNTDHSKKVLDWVKKEQPEIVFVALGAPYQEQWIIQHRDELIKANVRVAMVVGGAFDVLTGKVVRAPKLVRSIGLEWFWRLVQEPWRWRRQLSLIRFIQMVISSTGQKI